MAIVYDIKLISKHADFDAEFKGIPANSESEASAFCLRMMANPDAWLVAEARDALEAFRNPLTPFGMLTRALRIVSGTLLIDMATDLQLTPATLSAYECGRKPIPPELARHAADFFARKGIPNTLGALDAAMSAIAAKAPNP